MLSARTVINLSKQLEKILYKSDSVDDYGYIEIEKVLEELNNHPAWEYVSYLDIKEVVKSSALKRLEISGNKIRLIRLNSAINNTITHNVIPPKVLYYGTGIVGISRVKTFGIRSYKDQFVKLYPDKRMIQVLIHRNSHIAHIEIDAFKAHKDGIKFVKGDLNTYLAEYIPPQYIKKIT